MKIALLADLHLSDIVGTPQEETFEWALDELEALRPDAAVWLGDVTACGSLDAAMRFCKRIGTLSFPSVAVPGNSDIRTPATAPVAERMLFNCPDGLLIGNLRIVGVNSSHNGLSLAERERLSNLAIREDVLLCSHQSPYHMDGESRGFMEAWMDGVVAGGHRVLAWAWGHIHEYQEGEFHGVSTYSIRALDPDKCCHGSAQICILTVADGQPLSVEQIEYRRGLPEAWTDEERRELVDALGMTLYHARDRERDMAFAIENGVRHLEFRIVSEEDIPMIEAWRRSGGKTLSLHFPSLGWDGTGATNLADFEKYARDAVRAGMDMVTVHPPSVQNDIMLCTNAFDVLADAMAACLRSVAHAGIDILVENNHTQPGTSADPLARPYGCSPAELAGWRDALTARLGQGTCHVRLDVGHARNNAPLSQEYCLGKWYALVGKEARAYHLHQTVIRPDTGHMHNHYPITGFHDGLVSFDGFLWAWHTGALTHGPLILEIREADGAMDTWERIKHLVLEA